MDERDGQVDTKRSNIPFNRRGSVPSPPSPARPVHIACEQNMEALVPLLLDAGHVVDARDSQDCTPLFTAVRAGASTSVLKLLIDRGARPDVGPTGEPTPLMLAAGMGCLPTVQLLVRVMLQ